jgi:hypothetical protein
VATDERGDRPLPAHRYLHPGLMRAAAPGTVLRGALGAGGSVRKHSVHRSRPIADPLGVIGRSPDG